MCVWIRNNLGEDTPLHFSRFFPACTLTKLPPTPIKNLEEAREIAMEEGLRYVYIGNVPGHQANSLFCPQCGESIIARFHFIVLQNNLREGNCKFCGYKIPGIWS
jgi:pyruvate formate lyase activating enzyme